MKARAEAPAAVSRSSARRPSRRPAAAAATRSRRPAPTREIGPALDDLTAAADEAGIPVPEFVRSSIVDPDAVIAPDYQPGVMPKDFAQSLSPEELDALVAYLSGEAGE